MEKIRQPGFLLLDCRAVVLKLCKTAACACLQDQSVGADRSRKENPCGISEINGLRFTLTISSSYVEKMVIATLILSAGAHVSSNEPAIVLFGYLRHGLIGRGIELFGIVLLVLNFLDGLYKLSKLDWHAAYQIVMSLCYFVLSVRLVQLILAFRGE
jgi:hypothetical protein